METTATGELSRIGTPLLAAESAPDWVCHRVQLDPLGEVLRVGFTHPQRSHWCEIEVRRLDSGVPASRRYRHCQIGFHGDFGSNGRDSEEQAIDLVESLAAFVDSRLAALPQGGLAEALGRSSNPGSLPFDAQGVRRLLAPLIVDGAEVCDGYSLTRVAAESRQSDASTAPEVILGFQRPGMQGHVLFAVDLGAGDQKAFSRSAHLSLRCLYDAPETHRLRATLAYVLQLQDHEGVEFTAPLAEPAGVRSGAPSAFEPPPAGAAVSEGSEPPRSDAGSSDRPVILSLTSPCHQKCSFCSLRDTWDPDDGGDALLKQAIDELRAGRAQGSDAFTLNGFDPLSFSRILDLLDAARAMGYAHTEVYSPCTLLADRDFCAALVERLPPSRRVHVPLYALDAAVHEAVVGRPGTFDQVMAALELLIEFLGPEAITITTVSSRANLHALPALFRFAVERGLDYFSTMPYPATNFATDRIVDASPRQTEVAAALFDAVSPTPEWIDRATFGIAPCVIFPMARQRGIPVQSWLSVSRQRPQLNGGPLPNKVQCRHVASCVLASACPGEFFERYVAHYGDDEFQPVALYDLLRAAGANERPSEGATRRAKPSPDTPRSEG
jgi:hypothetical protein